MIKVYWLGWWEFSSENLSLALYKQHLDVVFYVLYAQLVACLQCLFKNWLWHVNYWRCNFLVTVDHDF